MANEEQVMRLKQGAVGWNKWREDNQDIKIDLRGAFLDRANLNSANLAEANLEKAHLQKADLEMADLRKANLHTVDFLEADLRAAKLEGADFEEAYLGGADLREANLSEASLKGANLLGTDFTGANLDGVKLNRAKIGFTIFGDIDLRKILGLDDVDHQYPSTIGINTIHNSKGKISEGFMRGCGLTDLDIEYTRIFQEELSTKEIEGILNRVHNLRVGQALQINPLFISYSHKDSTFVDTMEKHLDEKGIRFWRDIHDATAGRLEKVVDLAMRQNPTVLLVLSENSVKSDWVEHEARSARGLGKELRRDVLCPVALDDAWKDCAWPTRLREQIEEYHILDFSKWKDDGEFGKMFRKLIDGLDLFYKEE
jgi:hypothetical protein